MVYSQLRIGDITIGHGGEGNIRCSQVTELVNESKELKIGSTCCSCLEVTVQTEQSLQAGMEVEFYRVSSEGSEQRVGIFTLETPSRRGGELYHIVGYDSVAKLDVDLSDWLAELSGWPYSLREFAGMVCEACGLVFSSGTFPNEEFPVQCFSIAGVTGRQLIRWIAEAACRFCRADPYGRIVFDWYRDPGISLGPTGDRFYFAGTLSYEDYEVTPIDSVALRRSNGKMAAQSLSPNNGEFYVITGNPILLAKVDSTAVAALRAIRMELEALGAYRPCKVEVPESYGIRAGDRVWVTDRHGTTISTYAMSVVRSGQRSKVRCTGFHSRESTSSVNGRTVAQVAQQAVEGQTQEQIFDKLTHGGAEQGIYLLDGKIYINGSYIQAGQIAADLIRAGLLKSVDEKTYFDLDGGLFVCQSELGTVRMGNGNLILDDAGGVQRVRVYGSADPDGNEQYSVALFDPDGGKVFEVATAYDGRVMLMAPYKNSEGEWSHQSRQVGWMDDGNGGFYLGNLA